MTLTNPQPVLLLQTGDLVEGAGFDNWLDAVDKSFCTFEGKLMHYQVIERKILITFVTGGDDPTQVRLHWESFILLTRFILGWNLSRPVAGRIQG